MQGPSKVPVDFIQKLHETGAHLLGTSHRKDAVKNFGKEITLGLKNTSLSARGLYCLLWKWRGDFIVRHDWSWFS